MAIGATINEAYSRNTLILDSFSLLGINKPSGDQFSKGVRMLNSIVRELSIDGIHLWAVSSSPSAITIQANIASYTTSNGLPSNIHKIVKAMFRNPDGTDDPLIVTTVTSFAEIQNKFETGSIITDIYLTDDRDPSAKKLIIWPILTEVNTQSEVIGTDTNNYRCVQSHEASSDNKPITGADYLRFWELGGSSGAVWATGTSYVAPQQILLWYQRPLYDFDLGTDNPDIPREWERRLTLNLALDLSFVVPGITVEAREQIKQLAARADDKTSGKAAVETKNVYDKVTYF